MFELYQAGDDESCHSEHCDIVECIAEVEHRCCNELEDKTCSGDEDVHHVRHRISLVSEGHVLICSREAA